MSLARLPEPPYVAVVFTSVRSGVDEDGYARADAEMDAMVAAQRGYLGHEGARDPATGLGVTVSYWRTEADARAWKQVSEHLGVQRLGRERWYDAYRVVVAHVDRAYGFERTDRGPSGSHHEPDSPVV